jgi:hypothetical protein
LFEKKKIKKKKKLKKKKIKKKKEQKIIEYGDVSFDDQNIYYTPNFNNASVDNFNYTLHGISTGLKKKNKKN